MGSVMEVCFDSCLSLDATRLRFDACLSINIAYIMRSHHWQDTQTRTCDRCAILKPFSHDYTLLLHFRENRRVLLSSPAGRPSAMGFHLRFLVLPLK